MMTSDFEVRSGYELQEHKVPTERASASTPTIVFCISKGADAAWLGLCDLNFASRADCQPHLFVDGGLRCEMRSLV